MKDFFKQSITITGNFFAGLTGGGIFFLFFVFLNLHLLPSITAAIISYIAAFFIFAKARKSYELKINTGSIDEKNVRKILLEVKDKLNEIKVHSTAIKNGKIKNKIDEIANVVQKMYSNFEKDPEDIRKARQFILYYLESTAKIIRLYVELSSQDSNSKEIKASLERAETVLDVILHAFQVQHSRLLSNDVMDFNTEIEVLEKTLKMESME